MSVHEMAAPWSQHCVDVTCCGDGRSHRIDDAAFTAGLARDGGRVAALCGRSVVAAPMAAPPGEPCPLCSAVAALTHTRPPR